MKKGLIFTLLLLVATNAAMSAQESEKTPAPVFIEGYDNHIWKSFSDSDYSEFYVSAFNYVTFEIDEGSETAIYYRRDKYGEPTEWEEYSGNPIIGMGQGQTTVEAYAVAPGKLPSDTVSIYLSYYDELLYVACVVDGIHYYIDYSNKDPWNWNLTDYEVSVCSRKESQLYTPTYTGDLVIPSEIVFRDETYTVTGIRKAALAATYDYSSDITSVDVPGTVEEIGPAAFAGCIRLERMTVRAVTPPYAYELFEYDYGDDGFGYYDYIGFDWLKLYSQVTLYVPNESLEAYRQHEEWGKFTHIVPFIGIGPGDINGDGKIAITDVTALINNLMDSDELPAYCDADGDGEVTIKDVTLIITQLMKGN